jgi:hypothetical protein
MYHDRTAWRCVFFFCGQKIWLRRRFPGTCETVGQVFKFVWRICWKIKVVCMSLSPFDSFQSRLVTYLLNCPRIYVIYKCFHGPRVGYRCLKSLVPAAVNLHFHRCETSDLPYFPSISISGFHVGMQSLFTDPTLQPPVVTAEVPK